MIDRLPPDAPPTGRSRIRCALTALGVIALGLAWRAPTLPFTPFVRKYGADALWAWLVFLLLQIVRPKSALGANAAAAFGIAAIVEFTQLHHAPWIDAVRSTRLGALVLGSVFNAPDIAAYAVGIGAAVLIEWSARRIASCKSNR